MNSKWPQHFFLLFIADFSNMLLVSASEFCHQNTFDKNKMLTRLDTLSKKLYIEVPQNPSIDIWMYFFFIFNQKLDPNFWYALEFLFKYFDYHKNRIWVSCGVEFGPPVLISAHPPLKIPQNLPPQKWEMLVIVFRKSICCKKKNENFVKIITFLYKKNKKVLWASLPSNQTVILPP